MFKIRKVFLLLVIVFLSLCVNLYAQTPRKVTFIDVGHGDCILIQTPDDGIKDNGRDEGEIILIDGGEKVEGRKVIIPYLENHGIKEDKSIDVMIMTHAHSDHAGGLIPVIEEYKVKAVLDPNRNKYNGGLYGEFVSAVKKEPNCRYYRPLVGTLIEKEGDNLDWGSELEVKVLNSDKKAEEPNNTSIVIWLRYGEVSFLLPGDAEGKRKTDSPDKLKYVEKDLVKEYDGKLKSTFLKAGHHGSETSSTNAFIDAVSPRYVIICAGNKPFGKNKNVLPDKSVVKRYETKGIKIYRTDRDDQNKPFKEASGDDHIVITTDGTLKGTEIRYEDEKPKSMAGNLTAVPEEQKGKSISELGVVYKGMPKEYLENAGFTKYLLLDTKKEGSKEWMTFSDWTTPQPGDTITFIIEDGKVKD